ncbi:MAG: 50S ribosomal protein L3 [Nitrososphaerales archaeon]
MGHRKHNAPRRGSLAFYPRARHQTHIPHVRNWTKAIERPIISGFPAFKAGMVQVITVDDRERTPNYGKPMFNSATVLATPPVLVCGLRAYSKRNGRQFVLSDIFFNDLPEAIKQKIGSQKKSDVNPQFDKLSSSIKEIERLTAVVATVPKEAGLSNAIPQVQEIQVSGGDVKSQLEYLKGILGKQVKVSDLVKVGSYVDAIAVTKGKGFEGPVTRFGVKRKQHKSRKSVRAVGVISPWHPATVMYTVPRAGQMGFHQRIMKNNRILALGNAQQSPITPSGGFLHFGEIRGDFVILRGSVPGPIKRYVDLRLPIYPRRQKVVAPRIIEVSVGGNSLQVPK